MNLMNTPSLNIPAFADVERAAQRLKGVAIHTPLLRSAQLDAITGARVFVKAECLQLTGSFKFRGAYNTATAILPAQRKRGLVASSSGNHAQGVAEAARLLAIPATIVMPRDAPAIKIARTRRSGAQVVLYDREQGDRDGIAGRIVEETGGYFVHAFDNPLVIAGQGTCGLEIADALANAGIAPDRVLVCTGGGGLCAGVALAVHERFADARLHTVEPQGFDDYRRSLALGKIVANDQLGGSACDALLSAMPGEMTFAINQKHVENGLSVTDAQAFDAMRFAFAELKLVLEPGGAVALAALLAQGKAWQGETIVCVASGGNVDPAMFVEVLEGRP